jgi:serine/threonine protein kinase
MINHPNVVSIHDFSDATGQGTAAYIVMELVKGSSLRQLLAREGRMSAERAVALMRDICAGVGVAHRQGLLHRDLKPDNVIITPASHEREREMAKVVDFGLAKLRDVAGSAALTQTGAVMGTLYYMSPEQCKGEELGAQADVYSLGAMLFEMLTGGPPFQSSSMAGLITKHLHEPPPPFPESLRISPALAEVCFRALSKDRKQRQPDAHAFSRDLQTALTAPVHNQTFAPPAQTLRALRTSGVVPAQSRTTGWLKWTILAGGALLLVVALVGIGVAIKYGATRIANRSVDKSNNTNSQNTQRPSNNATVPAVQTYATPSAESESAGTEATPTDLKGTWTGTYGPSGQPAKLIIKTQKGYRFDGVLEQSGIRVAFSGTFDSASRVVTMKQSEVVSGGAGSWSLGEDTGLCQPGGKKLSGTGNDAVGGSLGISYQWSFTRQ